MFLVFVFTLLAVNALSQVLELATFQVGKGAYTCSQTDRYIMVVSREKKSVSIIDKQSLKLKKTFGLGLVTPVDVISDGERVYVSDASRNAVVVYNMEGEVLGSIRLYPSPSALLIKDGKLYVSSSKTGYIWVVDLQKLKVEQRINTEYPTPFFGFLRSGEFYYLNYKNYVPGLNRRSDLVLQIGDRIYRGEVAGPRFLVESNYGILVVGFYDGVLARVGSTILNVESSVDPYVSGIVEFAGAVVVSSLSSKNLSVFEPILMKRYMQIEVSGRPVDLAVLDNGKYLLVLTQNENTIEIYDTRFRKLWSVSVGEYPIHVMPIDSRRFGVLCADSGTFTIFEIEEE
ncbi:MAG TPA: hypothetical protein DHV12_03805 [Thermotogae bacterium]|nr:hypothetical protein [Thermotogota bacterium]